MTETTNLGAAPTYGEADGPTVRVPYIGETREYQDPRLDLIPIGKGQIRITLQYHVPMLFRGKYKLDSYPGLNGEREGHAHYALCTSTLKDDPSTLCEGVAINYSGLCSRHGGMLHPLDRRVVDWSTVPREIAFRYGHLPVEELDDEELAKGQIRKADGTFTDSNFVSSDIHDRMVRELFSRADVRLRENLVKTVDVFVEVASNDAFEPADRLRAAEFIYTRLRGKVPNEVVVTQQRPFEVVLTEMLTGGSRAQSRAQRGIVELEDGNVLDAEIVGDEAMEVVEHAAVVEEIATLQEYTGDEDVDSSLYDEYKPKVPQHIGPASAPLEGVPEDMQARVRYHKEQAEYDKEAEEKRKAFQAKRQEHRKKMRSARSEREWVKSEGYKSLPVPLPFTISPEDEGGTSGVRLKFTLIPNEG